jgi:ParB family chromosome partitioning protein
MDDLFNLNGGESTADTTIQVQHKNVVISVAINTLTPFKKHPFRLYEGERLDDMVESIKANGVLVATSEN